MYQRAKPVMPLIYIAGPLSGVINVEGGFPIAQRWENTHNAMRMALQLQDMGCACHVPHAYAMVRDEMMKEHPVSNERGRVAWDKELRMDEETILRCDALFRLPGISAGTDREVAFADKNGVPILHTIDEAKAFITHYQLGAPIASSHLTDEERNRIKFCTAFADFANELGALALEKGFWTAHRDRAKKAIQQELGNVLTVTEIECLLDKLEDADIVGDPAIYLGLIQTEVSEAINALRSDPPNWTGKDGVNEENADSFIRLMDFVVRYQKKSGLTPYGFAEQIYRKHAFNKTRPFRHGKRF